jgi:hypothetical protein
VKIVASLTPNSFIRRENKAKRTAMQITVLGLVLIPLSLLWVSNPVRLLQLSLFASIFAAAAALIFGGFGLQPGMVPGLLFIAYIFLQYAMGMRYPGEGAAIRAAFPLLLLLFYALMSAWLLPRIFAGSVFVEPQKWDPLGFDPLTPLQPSFGNVTQALYLMINIIFMVAVAIFLTRAAIPYESIIASYLLGGYVVVGLTFWQLGNRAAGIPFPDELLQSNPGWAIVTQVIGTVPRLQGPFSEPAALAGYMAGVALCCLWLSVRGYRIMRPNLLLGLAIATTLLSTSTTGILTIVVGLPFTLALASVGGVPGALGRIGKTVGLLMLSGLLVVVPILVLKPSLIDSVSTVVESTLSKGESDSYKDRSASDAHAIATLGPTFGLGVGWGSARSSSLIPGILANGGIFGAVMVLWFVIRVMRLSARARRASPGHPGQILVNGFTAALCCQIATALLSAPMISGMDFYLQLGCVLGVLVRMSLEPRAQGRRSNAPMRISAYRTTG